MDKQKKLRVFYSDISALRDRSDQPQLWEFLCCARQQKIKQCKNEDDRLRAFGAGLLLEYGLRQYGYTQTIPVGSPAAAELEQTGQTRSLQQVRFVYGKNGKPYLGTGQGERLPLMFNLSHSGMYVAAAFGTEDVGVDVELIRTGKQKIAQRFLQKMRENIWKNVGRMRLLPEYGRGRKPTSRRLEQGSQCLWILFHDGRTGGRILSENMECRTGCLAVCLPERECDRTLSAGENRIRTGVL